MWLDWSENTIGSGEKNLTGLEALALVKFELRRKALG
jgi:hypothetical protein